MDSYFLEITQTMNASMIPTVSTKRLNTMTGRPISLEQEFRADRPNQCESRETIKTFTTALANSVG